MDNKQTVNVKNYKWGFTIKVQSQKYLSKIMPSVMFNLYFMLPREKKHHQQQKNINSSVPVLRHSVCKTSFPWASRDQFLKTKTYFLCQFHACHAAQLFTSWNTA